jgi:hypothetical protein
MNYKYGSCQNAKKCPSVPIFHPPQFQPQQPGMESIMIPRQVIHMNGGEYFSQ